MKLSITKICLTFCSLILVLSSAFAEEVKLNCTLAIEKFIASQNSSLLNDVYANCYQLAMKGDGKAQYYVGWYFYSRKLDKKEGLKWMKLSAEQGYSGGQVYLGQQYESKKDMEQALYWYKKAAQQDEVLALLRLGKIYHKGLGTSIDGTQAIYWYEQAAKLNIGNAMRTLVEIYSKGIPGVQINKERARYWEKKLGK